MIKIGLIGCGYMGRMHTACYNNIDDVKVTAMGQAPESARAFARENDAEFYPDGFELIKNSNVDAVDICLPTFLHAKYAVEAMKYGKNVFVEKPAGLTKEERRQMLDMEKTSGVKVQVGQVLRFWDEYDWLKKTVDAGTYGKPVSAVFKRVSPHPGWSVKSWLDDVKLSGGIGIDMGVHDIDFMRYLFGEPQTIQAQAARDKDGKIYQLFAMFGYNSGSTVQTEASWVSSREYPFSAGYRVTLEKATAEYKDGKLTVYPDSGEIYSPEFPQLHRVKKDEGGNISELGGYYNELAYFADGLNGKNDLSRATLQDACRSVDLVEKVLEKAGGAILNASN